jgi:hypothetical protein
VAARLNAFAPAEDCEHAASLRFAAFTARALAALRREASTLAALLTRPPFALNSECDNFSLITGFAAFPGCTYCHPQVASVGLMERGAKEKGLKFRIGKMPFIASGKARPIGENEGFVKVIIGEPHGEILGAHISRSG